MTRRRYQVAATALVIIPVLLVMISSWWGTAPERAFAHTRSYVFQMSDLRRFLDPSTPERPGTNALTPVFYGYLLTFCAVSGLVLRHTHTDSCSGSTTATFCGAVGDPSIRNPGGSLLFLLSSLLHPTVPVRVNRLSMYVLCRTISIITMLLLMMFNASTRM